MQQSQSLGLSAHIHFSIVLKVPLKHSTSLWHCRWHGVVVNCLRESALVSIIPWSDKNSPGMPIRAKIPTSASATVGYVLLISEWGHNVFWMHACMACGMTYHWPPCHVLYQSLGEEYPLCLVAFPYIWCSYWLSSVVTVHVVSFPCIHRLLQMRHAFFASNVGVVILKIWEEVLHPDLLKFSVSLLTSLFFSASLYLFSFVYQFLHVWKPCSYSWVMFESLKCLILSSVHDQN